MTGRPTLAFIVRQESVRHLPASSTILPLRPSLSVTEHRILARRPEDVLDERLERLIGQATDQITASWWVDGQAVDGFEWKGVNLAQCFSYDLRLAVLDAVKTAWIVHQTLEKTSPETILTDAPESRGPFPAYPYLYGLGFLLSREAHRRHLAFQRLAAHAPRKVSSRPAFRRAYSSIAARQSLLPLQRDKVLLVVGPHRDFYLPVARAWRRSGGTTFVLTPANSPVRAAPDVGLYLLPAEAMLPRGASKDLRDFVDRSVRRLERLTLGGHGTQASTDLVPLLTEHIRSRLHDGLFAMAAVGSAFEGGLARAEHLLTVDTGSPFAAAAIRYARQHRVPVTFLQHGVLAARFAVRLIDADRIAAWGPSDVENIREVLGPSVRATATGCTRYDGLDKDNAKHEEGVLRHLPPNLPMVLFASQPFVQDRGLRSPWERTAIVNMAMDAAHAVEPVALVVKWHPSEVPERLNAEGRITHGFLLETQRADTFALLRRAKVLLTLSSTVALEAMYLDRPVVFLGSPEPNSLFSPPEDGAGLRARTAPELADLLRRLLSSEVERETVLKAQREYLETRYAPFDHRAADRVVSFLERG